MTLGEAKAFAAGRSKSKTSEGSGASAKVRCHQGQHRLLFRRRNKSPLQPFPAGPGFDHCCRSGRDRSGTGNGQDGVARHRRHRTPGRRSWQLRLPTDPVFSGPLQPRSDGHVPDPTTRRTPSRPSSCARTTRGWWSSARSHCPRTPSSSASRSTRLSSCGHWRSSCWRWPRPLAPSPGSSSARRSLLLARFGSEHTPASTPTKPSLWRRWLPRRYISFGGRPAPGKRRHVGAAVARWLRQKKRVLVVSTSNAAVDVAMRAVLKNLRPDEKRAVLRLGTSLDPVVREVTLGREDGGPKRQPLPCHCQAQERLRQIREMLQNRSLSHDRLHELFAEAQTYEKQVKEFNKQTAQPAGGPPGRGEEPAGDLLAPPQAAAPPGPASTPSRTPPPAASCWC